jgi:quinol monooxygenase YgiN
MNRTFLGASFALTLSACATTAPQAATGTTTNAPEGTMHTESNRNVSSPTAAAVVTHEVRDYDAWKAVFDEHAAARKRAGIKQSHVNRSADHPNVLSVYLAADTREAIGAFLADPEVKGTMQRGGVVGAPTVAMITVAEDLTVKDRPLAGAIIKHKVADYDTWKKAFDTHYATRAKAGVIGHAVNRANDDPNVLIVYLQAENLDSLRQLTSSEDMKSTMMKAGVQGPPEIFFVQGQRWEK